MPPTNRRFVIPFEEGRAAFAVYASHGFQPARVAHLLGFAEPHPTIYVTGGAGLMSPEDIRATQAIVERGIARFAEERGAVVIDGGTDVGIATMLGTARRKGRFRFPLVGIAPLELVNFSGHKGREPEAGPLNSGHSHFILTSGHEFGAESELITQMTHEFSGQGQQPALGILINGGKISREEVYARTTSDKMSFPLIIVEGSGRFADILARAFYAGHHEEKDVQAIISKGRLEIVSIKDGPEQMYARLVTYFNTYKPARQA